ncbi:hypothetical protein OJ996_20730 [Luteolibacter sp. GHJ8]|uniref:Twin-arginine translocation signal domain-containing protein n=1 Tax=Luteolibacter rhizosphaerae TaxID=2989719 RepID=A0ABT3G852_9BACT|nr:hypothetical protein [Luteolibacter rhizosphaerae]MCW1916026.1 hypothetical protein [Luteolibacter rhizosphaerae]
MSNEYTRRGFLATATQGALLGTGALEFLSRLPAISAAEAGVDASIVRFLPEIEPLVRLLEDTPRERVIEEVGQRIKTGTTHREILAATFLAGIRNIQPRPVGFKFHAVLVVNSAHLASQNSPDADRWLPLLWAVDQFKASQARDKKEGDWTMEGVYEPSVPPADRAAEAFRKGMDAWDCSCADSAAASLARGSSSQDAFDLFCRYGARDYRDIGHKAIYVANSWRLLQTIGWQHSEPVLRSLAYALLACDGTNPADGDALADRPGRKNAERLKELRVTWNGGENRSGAAADLLAVLRSGSWDEASAKVVSLINSGCSPQPVWDAMFQCSAELLMRAPGIIALHACTTTNALHYAFRHASDDETRRFLMLQNASFLPLFREDAGISGGVEIDTFEPIVSESRGHAAVDEIFAGLNDDRLGAARRTLDFLDAGGDPKLFTDAAQRLIYMKGTDSHDYKFSSAIIEDYKSLSPAFRNRFLAASVHWLKGSGGADSPLVVRSRAAL